MNLAWIPNSITLGNLLFGFLSLIFASRGQYQMAGFFILFAALLDGCDGQVARLLKVTSPLGAELDSLADCVTFGVAPGYLAHHAYLSGVTVIVHGKPFEVGMFIAAVFPLCAAYRLARFNVEHDPNSFCGLPSPIAGIIIALIAIAFKNPAMVVGHLAFFIPSFIIVALLMVSTVRFSKPQSYLIKKIHGIKLLLFLLLLAVLSFVFRKWILFMIIGFLGLYIISSITSFVIQFIQDNKY